MDSIPPITITDGVVVASSMVDPFLVEALQNPRHRLTILRMELDIQKFLHNSEQHQFEFQHFPTSYLRLAAHRVAQHYGLQTMVQDNVLDEMAVLSLYLLSTNPQRERERTRYGWRRIPSDEENSQYQIPTTIPKILCVRFCTKVRCSSSAHQHCCWRESFSSAKAHTCHRQGNRSCSVGWLLVTFSGLTSVEGSVLTFVLPFSII